MLIKLVFQIHNELTDVSWTVYGVYCPECTWSILCGWRPCEGRNSVERFL